MPTHTQKTVEHLTTVRDMGSADSASLQSSFPGSPIHSGEMTADQSLKSNFKPKLLMAQLMTAGIHSEHLVATIDDSPDLAEVKTGGGWTASVSLRPKPRFAR